MTPYTLLHQQERTKKKKKSLCCCQKRKVSSPTNCSQSKINSPLAMPFSLRKLFMYYPTTSHNVQSSSSIASTPDITPRTRTVMHKIIDFPSSIKPKQLFSVATGNSSPS